VCVICFRGVEERGLEVRGMGQEAVGGLESSVLGDLLEGFDG
jgi:hypothetical protein